MQVFPDTDFAKYIVWESGLTYRVLNKATGIIEHSGTNAYDAIKYAQSGAFQISDAQFPRAGDSEFVIKDGDYKFFSGFTGFDIRERTKIRMGHGTRLSVPLYYSGDVFKIHAHDVQGTAGVMIEGGQIEESGSPTLVRASGRLWTAFHFYASGHGVFFSDIKGVEIWNPKVAFRLECANAVGQSFLTSNKLEDNTVWYPVEFMRFDNASGTTTTNNQFINNRAQYNSGADLIGVDMNNGIGKRNTFIDCTMWDMSASGNISMRIGAQMEDTIIIGGVLTSDNFTDNGTRTRVLDGFTPFSTDVMSTYFWDVYFCHRLFRYNPVNYTQSC